MDILTIQMTSGVIINAIVIEDLAHNLLCYSQNRLFTVFEDSEDNYYFDKVLVEYCVIPEYDTILSSLSSPENEE